MAEVLAYESFPLLGDDALNVQTAALVLGNDDKIKISKQEYTPLQSLATQIQFERRRQRIPSQKVDLAVLDASRLLQVRRGVQIPRLNEDSSERKRSILLTLLRC